MSFTQTYPGKILVAVDMFVCSVIWRDSGITISSMTGLALRRPSPPRWAKVLGFILNHIQENHTGLSIEGDIARAKAALVTLGDTCVSS
jgi:hypothetical protein